ncbi:hypothetical protein R3W88_003550 [Solanum pinnatisectum]|uniref:Uncharacterized protein n=1 Tax=Solanum pinnatisectum TaxID=50273 RepID=A0AAV9MPB3_9SOLN|nr:hypothetical protein R3W88_003550 [Solanum pinnatisectum]
MDVLSTEITQLFKASQYFLRELSERVKHDNVRTVEVIVALQKHSKGKFDYITRKKTSLASEIGSIEDKDSVGAVGTLEIFKGWVIESLSNRKDLVPGIGRNKCRSMRCPLIQLLLQVLLRPGEFS